jgi:hypothetical protein
MAKMHEMQKILESERMSHGQTKVTLRDVLQQLELVAKELAVEKRTRIEDKNDFQAKLALFAEEGDERASVRQNWKAEVHRLEVVCR